LWVCVIIIYNKCDMIHFFVLVILFYSLLYIVYFKFYICCQGYIICLFLRIWIIWFWNCFDSVRSMLAQRVIKCKPSTNFVLLYFIMHRWHASRTAVFSAKRGFRSFNTTAPKKGVKLHDNAAEFIIYTIIYNIQCQIINIHYIVLFC
jgi:hypothetical protein